MTAFDGYPPVIENQHLTPALDTTALALRSVSVRRGDVLVLKGIDLAIPAGRITAIVGRSGVGKTTLVATLNGLIRPADGAVLAPGVGDLADPGALREHRRSTATIFQDHALIDRLSAIDNVLLGLADQRHPLSPLPWPEALRRRAAEALDEVGLLHRATARTATLSGGERQRVGVARALVRRPSLLLGDEPFASVDPALVRQMSAEFRTLAQRNGLTVVLVLHQLETARLLADRIVGLVDGRIAFDGAAEAFDAEAEAAIFPFPNTAKD
ncbi:MAG: ATP-binding cassette domain-containing protein [Magnetospirillum sp.]|nr:ATP-binding cassette domain-containing protein [Magnetospirillum sp.]